MKNWKINSWRKYPVKHIPQYEDEKELEVVLNKLKTFPPSITKKLFQICKKLYLEVQKFY